MIVLFSIGYQTLIPDIDAFILALSIVSLHFNSEVIQNCL